MTGSKGGRDIPKSFVFWGHNEYFKWKLPFMSLSTVEHIFTEIVSPFVVY